MPGADAPLYGLLPREQLEREITAITEDNLRVTYLGHDLERRRTAAALHVHPNTSDYRLRLIVELSGVDASTARGLQLLGAALTVRRLAGGR